MFTKLILPLLGGAPNVWNTAMVFFQALLLGGYVYAHVLSRYVPLRGQVALHVAVTALGLLFLPLAVDPNLRPPDTGMPTLWLLALFTATVGLPFFALSANAPLLQRWFSRTDHPDADDPYFLYAASNAGSLLILLAYPFIIEPQLRLGTQTSTWTLGYAALVLCLLGSGAFAYLQRKPKTAEVTQPAPAALSQAPLSLPTIALWTGLAFIPSSLMLGVTTFASSNVASGPLLWILPLALYLLTFVIVFAKRPLVTTAKMARLMPWVPLIGLYVAAIPTLPPFIRLGGSLAVVFFISLYCHARLVEARPDVSRLTIFYIVMSVGGVLGGIFNALLAPILFAGVYEYALILFVSAFVLPTGAAYAKPDPKKLRLGLIALLSAVVAVSALLLFSVSIYAVALVGAILTFVALNAFGVDMYRRIFTMAAFAMVAVFTSVGADNTLYKDRSFFSAMTVTVVEGEAGTEHRFQHGDTVHGYQLREEGHLSEGQLYYRTGAAFDQVIKASREVTGGPSNVAMIGLGIGVTSCFERPGDNWTYFEIDPKVVELAKRPDLFSFMSRCAPEATILVGDARQRLFDVPAASKDLIVIDAFTSNAIPAHLLTREAIQLYQTRLSSEKGLIFFHTSNRFADVSSVAAQSALAEGLSIRFVGRGPDTHLDQGYDFAADGVLVGREDVLAALDKPGDMLSHYTPSPSVKPWTDDYSSILGAMWAMRKKDSVKGTAPDR